MRWRMGRPTTRRREGQATFPRIFTVTMYDGHGTLTERDADGGSYDGEVTYTVDGDQVTFDSGGGNVETYAFRVDDDGTLHLEPQGAMDPGGVFVMTTKPWTRIADGTDTTATVLDGTYRWTLTKDDALTQGLPGDRTPEVLATFPSTFTMTMDVGTWQLANVEARTATQTLTPGTGPTPWRATTSCSTRPPRCSTTRTASTPTAPCTSSPNRRSTPARPGSSPPTRGPRSTDLTPPRHPPATPPPPDTSPELQ